MDEMEEYRERIERRYGGRRAKNDRRRAALVRPAPKFIEPEIVVTLLLVVAFGVALYFTH